MAAVKAAVKSSTPRMGYQLPSTLPSYCAVNDVKTFLLDHFHLVGERPKDCNAFTLSFFFPEN